MTKDINKLAITAARGELLLIIINTGKDRYALESAIEDYTWRALIDLIIGTDDIENVYRVSLSEKPEDADCNESILEQAGKLWVKTEPELEELQTAPTCWRQLEAVENEIYYLENGETE